ncbi:GH116 family glycosyl-hydrolase [Thermogutta sp.]|uniref:GH116 family glycosyl-hydrolase n=1 Tax=Thermogutta sp. TaxID=1962930 RepID=UPI00321FE9F5
MRSTLLPVLTWLLIALSCKDTVFPAEASVPKHAQYRKLIEASPGLVWYLPLQSFDEVLAKEWRAEGDRPQAVPGPDETMALRFSGKTTLTFGPTPDLDTEEATIELWFRPEFPAPARFNPCLIAKRESGDHRQTRWSIHVHGDYSAIDLWNGQEVASYRPATGPLQPGQWYHLVVVSTKEGTSVYLNGVPCLPPQQSWQINRSEKNRPLNIGSSQPAGAEFFTGTICQVALYSRALTEEEIATHTDAMGFHDIRLAAQTRYEQVRRAEAEEQAKLEEAREKRRRELMEDPSLFARGAPTVYEKDRLTAIDLPVGGIGVGAIHMDGTARRHAWQIFGQVAYRFVPHSFFAVQVRSDDRAVERILQTFPEEGLPPMAEVRLVARYPLARYEFIDPDFPVQVSLETFNPLIPTKVRDSAIPCAVYQITVKNPTEHRLSVTVLASQLNATGYRGDGPIEDVRHPNFGGNVNRVVRTQGSTWLTMAQSQSANSGDGLVLLMKGDRVHGVPAWTDIAQLRAVVAKRDSQLDANQLSAGPSPAGETLKGALWRSLDLEPGQAQTVTCVLAWFFSDLPAGTGKWSCGGRRYEAWWRSAEEVAAEVDARLSELEAGTRLYVDSLYETNLPYWFVDRIASQVAILRSPTVFWCRDGYFGGWEGCNIEAGCCPGNCNHVWHYAQAHARLFPELGRLMREQEFRFQKEDGAIPHRQPDEFPAFDGQCGAVLNSYREHLLCRDSGWLAKNWLAIKKAMDYIIQRWDPNEDGVPSGPQWNTLDGELGGASSWLGSLYLAALVAAEKMAQLQGENDVAARYHRIRVSGQTNQDKLLFNGEYYIQIPEPTPYEDYGQGCGIDQVLGQWWAHQLDLGWVYPPEHVRIALSSLFHYNFRGFMKGLPQKPRKFVADEDAGMQMFTWPPGTKPPAKVIRYASEVMTGFEYAAAAAMIQAGLLREGFTVVRAIAVRYDGRKRTGLTPGNFTSWGYSGNPFGDDECGKFYARAMSSWSLLLACQGFIYDGPTQTIGFQPIWKPDDHISFFTAAEGWGVFCQKREPGQQVSTIELRWGRLPLTKFITELPDSALPKRVECQKGGKAIPVQLEADKGRVACCLAEPIVLQPGEKLTFILTY